MKMQRWFFELTHKKEQSRLHQRFYKNKIARLSQVMQYQETARWATTRLRSAIQLLSLSASLDSRLVCTFCARPARCTQRRSGAGKLRRAVCGRSCPVRGLCDFARFDDGFTAPQPCRSDCLASPSRGYVLPRGSSMSPLLRALRGATPCLLPSGQVQFFRNLFGHWLVDGMCLRLSSQIFCLQHRRWKAEGAFPLAMSRGWRVQ